MRPRAALVALFWGGLLALSSARAACPCQGRRDLVDACFPVKGKLALTNGTPSARISVAGTDRILGVEPHFEAHDETFCAPASVIARARFDQPLSGTFTVCPLSVEKPLQMRLVCIQSAQLGK